MSEVPEGGIWPTLNALQPAESPLAETNTNQ
jgi:hypothetical protein